MGSQSAPARYATKVTAAPTANGPRGFAQPRQSIDRAGGTVARVNAAFQQQPGRHKPEIAGRERCSYLAKAGKDVRQHQEQVSAPVAIGSRRSQARSARFT